MHQARRHHPVAVALWVNAILLAGILISILSRGRTPGLPMALAAEDTGKFPLAPQPIAGGGGMFLMPAQFAVNQWGCYIMDIDRQTICAYLYTPQGGGNLALVAARNFTYDRMLKNYNTGSAAGGLTPKEVLKLVEKEKEDERVKAAENAPQPAPETPKTE